MALIVEILSLNKPGVNPISQTAAALRRFDSINAILSTRAQDRSDDQSRRLEQQKLDEFNLGVIGQLRNIFETNQHDANTELFLEALQKVQFTNEEVYVLEFLFNEKWNELSAEQVSAVFVQEFLAMQQQKENTPHVISQNEFEAEFLKAAENVVPSINEERFKRRKETTLEGFNFDYFFRVFNLSIELKNHELLTLFSAHGLIDQYLSQQAFLIKMISMCTNATYTDTLELLLTKCPKIGSVHGGVLLCKAAEFEHNTKIVKLLLDQGLNVNHKTNSNWTPLHYAVYMRNTEIVKTLLEHGADISIQNSKGQTPLHIIAALRLISLKLPNPDQNIGVIEELLKNNIRSTKKVANLSLEDSAGWSYLTLNKLCEAVRQEKKASGVPSSLPLVLALQNAQVVPVPDITITNDNRAFIKYIEGLLSEGTAREENLNQAIDLYKAVVKDKEGHPQDSLKVELATILEISACFNQGAQEAILDYVINVSYENKLFEFLAQAIYEDPYYPNPKYRDLVQGVVESKILSIKALEQALQYLLHTTINSTQNHSDLLDYIINRAAEHKLDYILMLTYSRKSSVCLQDALTIQAVEYANLAEELYQKLFNGGHEYPSYHLVQIKYNLACALKALGKSKEALPLLIEVQESWPTAEDAKKLDVYKDTITLKICEIYLEQNNLEQAKEEFKKFAEITCSSFARLALAMLSEATVD